MGGAATGVGRVERVSFKQIYGRGLEYIQVEVRPSRRNTSCGLTPRAQLDPLRPKPCGIQVGSPNKKVSPVQTFV